MNLLIASVYVQLDLPHETLVVSCQEMVQVVLAPSKAVKLSKAMKCSKVMEHLKVMKGSKAIERIADGCKFFEAIGLAICLITKKPT